MLFCAHSRAAAGTRGARWEKGTTPPLGLGHLRDNLERSRGTTDGQARHAHAPAGARSAAAGRPPSTDAGRTAREAHAKEAKRECLLRPRTTDPPAPRGRGRETEGQGRRPPPLPSTHPSTGQEGVKREARGPRTEREERSRSPGTSVPRLARLRSGPGERDITTSISQSSEPGARKLRRGGAR